MSPEQVEQAAKDIKRAIETLENNGAQTVTFEADWPGKRVIYDRCKKRVIIEDRSIYWWNCR